ncbi:DUF6925 family protein [Azospirillum doebereinerae]|uniref:DUF6925 family protein n=1 Tax=Azospirillum doebereinerae TaxID=92933 RepID=UPI001EE5200F|nr:hypothetical protein [Azospirillum doebereinerae]MCG5244091.1 hypothetical protein [Azospirillum doebereinerae]
MTDALPPTHDPSEVAALLRAAVADPATAWSLGSFGAVAEFLRDADEPVRLGDDGARLEARTARGGLRLRFDPAVRPVAYETAAGTGWSQAVALCLPADACAMSGRGVVTELGPDADALAPEDRDGVLFDIGLGLPQTDACVRSADPRVVERLRAGVGRALFDPENPLGRAMPELSPTRVFLGRFGRIEVGQPIPPPGGASPEGPHTHVLPRLLAAGRTHAATAPIPDGWVPVVHLFPPHPAKDGNGRPIPFDRGRHAAFQALLERHGVPALVGLKRAVLEALHRNDPPIDDAALDRAQRLAVRVAVRQAATLSPGLPRLADWVGRFDRPDAAGGEEARPAR